MKNRVTIITDSENESEALEELTEVLKTSEVSVRKFLSLLASLEFGSVLIYSDSEERETIDLLYKIHLNLP